MNSQRILGYGATEEKGEHARLSAFIGAIAVTDMMKTTLGPKGMDKIIVSQQHDNEMEVTNDGATILRSLQVDNPCAKILIDISKSQDDEVGDGTTSVCVLAGELLREAERLVSLENIHPQTIAQGWRRATKAAQAALLASSFTHGDNKEQFYQDMIQVASTTLSSKVLLVDKEHFAKMAVDAVLRLKGSDNLNAIHMIKKAGGTLRDSYLDEGFILEKKPGVGQPKRVENAKILLANTAMDHDKIKIFGAKVRADAPEAIQAIENAEIKRRLEKCEKISAFGCNCFINRQLIYNLAEEYFANKGIMAIEHADFEGTERLALVTGADIVSTFDNASKQNVQLGECDLIEQIMIGEDTVLRFSGCKKSEACSIVLRGSSMAMLDEAERSLHDALCVVSTLIKDNRVVYGGGCTEILMSKAVEEEAKKIPGKEGIAMEAFARALRQMPSIIAENGGYDGAELTQHLRAAHYEGKTKAGLDMNQGVVGDMESLGVYESYKVKSHMMNSASEAAEMILRVDNILRSAPRQRQQGY